MPRLFKPHWNKVVHAVSALFPRRYPDTTNNTVKAETYRYGEKWWRGTGTKQYWFQNHVPSTKSHKKVLVARNICDPIRKPSKEYDAYFFFYFFGEAAVHARSGSLFHHLGLSAGVRRVLHMNEDVHVL